MLRCRAYSSMTRPALRLTLTSPRTPSGMYTPTHLRALWLVKQTHNLHHAKYLYTAASMQIICMMQQEPALNCHQQTGRAMPEWQAVKALDLSAARLQQILFRVCAQFYLN